MQSTSYSHFHGYVNSAIDRAVRVRLTNGQIVALTITPTGIEAHLLEQKLCLPEELRQLSNVSQLGEFLKSHRLGLSEKEITIERQIGRVPPQEMKTSPPISFNDICQ